MADQKYLVTTLVRCEKCELMYRSPITGDEENRSFYQKAYKEGFTTDLPSESQLRTLLDSGFPGEKNYKKYIDVLTALGCSPGQRLFDFGCSWGYGSWQFKSYGFEVESFEISQPRANFAREKLGLRVFSSMDDVAAPVDIFFSAHVLEHVPSVAATIETALRILRPGGLFVAFTPNGSEAYRSIDPGGWHRLWGYVHPQMLDDIFYRKRFGGDSVTFDTSPYDLGKLSRWSQGGDPEGEIDLSGGELLCAYRKTSSAM